MSFDCVKQLHGKGCFTNKQTGRGTCGKLGNHDSCDSSGWRCPFKSRILLIELILGEKIQRFSNLFRAKNQKIVVNIFCIWEAQGEFFAWLSWLAKSTEKQINKNIHNISVSYQMQTVTSPMVKFTIDVGECIDAPLNQIALFKQIMLAGFLVFGPL